jgi:protein gp37
MVQDHHIRCALMVKAVEVLHITYMGTAMEEVSISTTMEMSTTPMAIRVISTTTLGREMVATMEPTRDLTTTMVITTTTATVF